MTIKRSGGTFLGYVILILMLAGCGGGGGTSGPTGPDPLGTVTGTADSGSASSGTSSPTSGVPTGYADLYGRLSTDVSDFQTAIQTAWNGSMVPVDYAGQLTSANSNIGPRLLDPSSMTQVDAELDYLHNLGARAVSVEVSFPMLYQPFLGSSYSQWTTFYAGVAAAVRARGMKLIVESQSLIPTGLESSAWGPQLQTFYPSLSLSQYVTARASTAAVAATTMQPDYLVLQEEPDTESQQAGQPALGTVAGSTAMLNETHAAVMGLVPGMKVGAGFGTWLAQYQAFANAFTQTGASPTQPIVTTPLDFLDIHLYPIIEDAVDSAPGVPALPGSANFWQNAMAVVATANAAGMHMSISQAWLRKVEDSEWLILPDGGSIEEAREAYSFWSPLDQGFLKIIHDLANYQGMYFVAPFNTQNMAAYLDWSLTTSIQGDPDTPPGALAPAQVFSTVQTAALTAQSQGTSTSTGQYWQTLIQSSP